MYKENTLSLRPEMGLKLVDIHIDIKWLQRKVITSFQVAKKKTTNKQQPKKKPTNKQTN